MRFGMVSRIDQNEAIMVSRKVLKFLEENSDVVLEDKIGEKIGREGVPLKKLRVDVIVTVGGDGTILRVMQNHSAPVFGINVGIVGFLTEVRPENAIEGLRRVMRGDYIIDRRAKLKTMLNDKRLFDCVNEAVIHTDAIAKIRHFEILVSDDIADNIRADGIIIATPTGSTCYAMSVGSPILDPKVNAFVISPIAAFRLSARSIIVPSESEITLRVLDGKSAILVLDGQYRRKVTSDDVLRFTISENKAEFIRFDTNFYRRIKERLV